MDLSREYLLSDEPKRRVQADIQRLSARIEARRLRDERRRRRLNRLSLGLLGR